MIDSSGAVLAARQVTKAYGAAIGTVHAVRGISLAVHPGRTLAVVGESGCGKSTLARLLVGLEPPDSGEIKCSSNGRAGSVIPMVFQDSLGSLHPRRTVRQLMLEPVLIREGRWQLSEGDRQRARELAQQVGLADEHLGRFPHELSGGQRQRVNIARALALEPDVLVLDEPVSALDVSIQAQILNLLVELQEKRKLALVFISHDLSVVRHIAHDIAVLYLGEVVESGPAAEVLRTPYHPYTKALVASDPAASEGEPQRVLAGEPPSPFTVAIGCPFAGRCPEIEPGCREIKPELRIHGIRAVACHPASRALQQQA